MKDLCRKKIHDAAVYETILINFMNWVNMRAYSVCKEMRNGKHFTYTPIRMYKEYVSYIVNEEQI